MAEPALREQLSSYIARRVSSHAEAAVELYEQCSKNEWRNTSKNRILLDTSEKLSKLSNKLPHKPFSEQAQKISSLLKLGQIEECPSHKAQEGMKEAISSIEEQLKIEVELLLEPNTTQIKQVLLAVSSSKSKALQSAVLGDIPIHSFSMENVNAGTCTIIDVDFKGKGKGVSLAKKILQANPHSKVIFFSDNKMSFETKLNAIRAGGHFFIDENLTSKSLKEALNAAFHIDIDPKTKILALDDSPSQLKHLENVLENAGFMCTAISQPELLLDAIETNQPDLLLLDVILPKCTGVELARLVRQHSQWRNIPIIFLSAEEDPNVHLNSQELSTTPFLTKPTDQSKLVNAIKQQLSDKQPHSK